MHILITGDIGAGKSTLINKLLRQVEQPIYGCVTEKLRSGQPQPAPVYIHPARGERVYTEDNLVGLCSANGGQSRPAAFDAAAERLLADIPPGAVVVLDELGFMESAAQQFCAAVLRLLDGPYYVLAAVKPKDTPFLTQVRAQKNALLYTITTSNQNELEARILGDIARLDADSPLAPARPNLDYFLRMQEQGPPDANSAAKWDALADKWEQEHSRAEQAEGESRISATVDYLRSRQLLGPEDDVVDVGCGPGRLAAAFARTARQVVGLDISAKMISHATAHAEQAGLDNLRFHVGDFHTLDIERAGLAGQFDLAFSAITPAVRGMDSINKLMRLSRKYCFNSTHINSSCELETRLTQELFGRERPDQWSGHRFYSLFNILFLLGYYPEATYYHQRKTKTIRPTLLYAERLAEALLLPEERTAANAERIYTWLQAQADDEGLLTEEKEHCYGQLLWDVRRRAERPDYSV